MRPFSLCCPLVLVLSRQLIGCNALWGLFLNIHSVQSLHTKFRFVLCHTLASAGRIRWKFRIQDWRSFIVIVQAWHFFLKCLTALTHRKWKYTCYVWLHCCNLSQWRRSHSFSNRYILTKQQRGSWNNLKLWTMILITWQNRTISGILFKISKFIDQQF